MLNFEPLYEMYGPVYAGPGAAKEQKYIKPRKLKAHHNEAINKAKKYAMEQSIRAALLKQSKEQETQRLMQVKLNQAMLLLSRVYIGSINYDIKESQIRQAFRCFGPVKSVSLSFDPITQKHMGYCFLEFDFPEAAQLLLAQQGTGISISGRQCKLGRPANMPQTGPLVDDLYNEAYKLARIYVTNIRYDIPSCDVKSVFEAFGDVVSCDVHPDLSQPGLHRGFAFIEFKTIPSCLEAIQAMNHFDLGGQLLYVSRAITPPNMVLPASTGTTMMMSGQMPAAAAVAAASITAQVQALEVVKTFKIDESDSVEVNRKRGRQKFSDTKVATDKVGAPTLVIPEKIKDKFNQRDLEPTVILAVPKTEKLISKSEDNFVKSGSIFDQIDQMKSKGEEIRNQILPELTTDLKREQQTNNSSALINDQCVMLLRNLVGRDQLDEYIEDEVQEECSKFGIVKQVKIFITNIDYDDNNIKQPKLEQHNFKDEVRVFVVFEKPESINEAVLRMNGRFFGGRIVIATKYDQNLYDKSEYMG